MSATNEYTGSITQGMKSYATLGCYYGAGSTGPELKPNQVNKIQLVPTWGSISYDALTHGVDCNGKYFNITNAYGAGATTCSTPYAQRLCGGCNNIGGGEKYRCAPHLPGGGDCIKVHAGTKGGPTYDTYDECKQQGCPYKV
tara:strand:+ start:255 stop:680 length:426 start_codon:yes stop_codon:yes gene_type:complete